MASNSGRNHGTVYGASWVAGRGEASVLATIRKYYYLGGRRIVPFRFTRDASQPCGWRTTRTPTRMASFTSTATTPRQARDYSLGSTSVMSNESGAQYGDPVRYYPFGEQRSGDLANLPTDHGFTGHKHNDTLGLIYMNARFYVPGIGRFASADTIVPGAANPQAFNRYSYVINNPLILIDPSGHQFINQPGGGSASPPSPDDPIRFMIEDDPLMNDLGIRGFEIIVMPPGHVPHSDNHELARFLGYVGASVDGVEAAFALAEMFGVFPGASDFTAMSVDVIIAYFASLACGETGGMQLHESLPYMQVLGQDVLLNAAEGFGVAFIKKALVLAGLAEGHLPGMVVGYETGAALDVGTSLTMMFYDIARAEDEFPTYFALAVYWDESEQRKLPFDWAPRGLPSLALIVYPPEGE